MSVVFCCEWLTLLLPLPLLSVKRTLLLFLLESDDDAWDGCKLHVRRRNMIGIQKRFVAAAVAVGAGLFLALVAVVVVVAVVCCHRSRFYR
jgi:hypothetical protein